MGQQSPLYHPVLLYDSAMDTNINLRAQLQEATALREAAETATTAVLQKLAAWEAAALAARACCSSADRCRRRAGGGSGRAGGGSSSEEGGAGAGAWRVGPADVAALGRAT